MKVFWVLVSVFIKTGVALFIRGYWNCCAVMRKYKFWPRSQRYGETNIPCFCRRPDVRKDTYLLTYYFEICLTLLTTAPHLQRLKHIQLSLFLKLPLMFLATCNTPSISYTGILQNLHYGVFCSTHPPGRSYLPYIL